MHQLSTDMDCVYVGRIVRKQFPQTGHSPRSSNKDSRAIRRPLDDVLNESLPTVPFLLVKDGSRRDRQTRGAVPGRCMRSRIALQA